VELLGDRGTCVNNWLLHDSRMARSRTCDPATVSVGVHAFNRVSRPKEKS